jgi:hypothetical protein
MTERALQTELPLDAPSTEPGVVDDARPADARLTTAAAPGDDWPPDAGPRARIARDLDANLLVEAGAGSGKTTAMVGRMVALVRTGTATVDQVAAVTFTRKAAAELRERFQEALEAAFRDPRVADDERHRIGRALRDVDRCFAGTIHAFCGSLLRERPLEAGVPPGFREVSGTEEERLRAEAWAHFLEYLGARGSRLPGRLAAVGIAPAALRDAFREVADNPDVRWRAPAAPRPSAGEVASVRAALERLLERSWASDADGGARGRVGSAADEGADAPLLAVRARLGRRRAVPGRARHGHRRPEPGDAEPLGRRPGDEGRREGALRRMGRLRRGGRSRGDPGPPVARAPLSRGAAVRPRGGGVLRAGAVPRRRARLPGPAGAHRAPAADSTRRCAASWASATGTCWWTSSRTPTPSRRRSSSCWPPIPRRGATGGRPCRAPADCSSSAIPSSRSTASGGRTSGSTSR